MMAKYWVSTRVWAWARSRNEEAMRNSPDSAGATAFGGHLEPGTSVLKLPRGRQELSVKWGCGREYRWRNLRVYQRNCGKTVHVFQEIPFVGVSSAGRLRAQGGQCLF